MLVSIHSKSKNSLPLLPLSAKWFVNRRSLLVSPSYPAIEFRAVCVSYCLLHTGVPLVHTSTTCGVLASLFKRLSSVSAFLAASTVTMVAFLDFYPKKFLWQISMGGFICTSPSWLSVTSSSSQCFWIRMAFQMIECYFFRCHFSKPQKRGPD